jgi:predicted ATPase
VATPHNPYAAALDGLELDDPVTAFFDFCRARERVRLLRESGAPAPWSDDPIFQRGRFLNVFREDDRGSRAILRFATPLTDDLPRLLHALFFARWCNSQRTLDTLSAQLLANPVDLREALQSLDEPPWCNETAYPVEAVTWEGETYSRFDTATTLFGAITPFLVDAICGADGNVTRATERVNARFGLRNDFPIFMAVMDLAWFRPEVIHPSSPVPTGIGAVAFLDRLQAHLGLSSHTETCDQMMALQAVHWPEARRPLQPIDIEYLSCECRKYYSYVNGTKAFEGKNLFRPASTVTPYFDIPFSPPSGAAQTRLHVIAGGPCSGKTSVIEALADAGYRVQEETAERLIKAGVAEGHRAEDLRADPVRWQRDIYRQDHALFDSLPVDELIFTDTSMIESLVFGERAGFSTGPRLDAWLGHKRYAKVFFLAPLTDYEQTAVRIESQQAAREISAEVKDRYRRHGYELTPVPAAPVAQRVQFILSHIAPNDTHE